jgi:hypothetical protein
MTCELQKTERSEGHNPAIFLVYTEKREKRIGFGHLWMSELKDSKSEV